MLRIFILGPYRSIDGSKQDLELLRSIRTHLRNFGWDALLAIDEPDDRDDTERLISPFHKTLRLSQACDALFFVFTSSGRLEGVVSELTALQIKDPGRAARRVVFLEHGMPLSAVLDADQRGVFASPPIAVVPFENKIGLVAAMTNYAKLIAKYGGTRRAGGG